MRIVIRLRHLLLKPAVKLQNRLPAAFFSRWTQVGIDASLSAISLFVAYQLRFDTAVPPIARNVMYTWILLLSVLRPALMWHTGMYKMTWRYFSFQDAIMLCFGALPSTVILLALRIALHHIPLLANPISVICTDAAIFVLLASVARALRRLVTEESLFSTGHGTRVVLVGSDTVIAGALHQISAHRNLDIVGLLVPSLNGLRDLRICGSPVLGEPAILGPLLQERKADLVMITDARLDCIGDVVSVATNHGIEVRMLPSATDVLRGDVSISLPRRVSKRVERVLVLGGAGYLGSTLVPMLLARGYNVRVLDRLLFGPEPLNEVAKNPNFELMIGDVRDIQAVVGAIKQCDAVIDLAAIVGDPACAVNKHLSLEVNRAASRMLIEICKGYGVSRLVFASTCSVYGASDHLVDELTDPAPISIYAQTKVASEQLLLEAASTDFYPVILRLGTLFGHSPRPRFDLVVNLLTARAASMGKITIFNGEQWRPFLHVRDAARAFMIALEASPELVGGEIFNVGDYSLNLRLSAVSEKIATIIPSVTVEHIDNTDKRNYRVSFDKIHTQLDFRCEKSVEFGIREIYAVIKSGEITDFTASQFNNQIVTATFATSVGAAQSSIRLLARLAA
jgi:nucleoside-diphosphate-sugar epimerase